MECGPCLLMYCKLTAEESDVIEGMAMQPQEVTESRVDQSTGSSSEVLAMSEVKEEVESTSRSSKKIMDNLLANLEILKETIVSVGQKCIQDLARTPEVEKKISNVTVFPSPTWSMLQEENIENTKHPHLASGLKLKVMAKTLTSPRGQETHVHPKEIFQEKKIADYVSSSRGPFVRVKVEDSESPLTIGVDDTSKTQNDIDDERGNLQIWTALRSLMPEVSKKFDHVSRPPN